LPALSLTPGQDQRDVHVRFFIDKADELAQNLHSDKPSEQNYARGYVAGAYDGWASITAKSKHGPKITNCVFTQKELASSEIATVFQAYLIKHPDLAHTPASDVLSAAFDETCGID